MATTAQLHPKVNIKMIIVALLDRLAAYAQDEQGNFVESKDNVLFIMFWNEIMELVKVVLLSFVVFHQLIVNIYIYRRVKIYLFKISLHSSYR